ncbi:MAG: hypothetical protein GXP08_07840 [Gammaproteobacteria bacterium]|nr:hypothetical protein [Gammaproteobacteria bacterium]
MKLNKLSTAIASAIVFGATMTTANAAQWDITVTNLTHGNYFTPLLLTAHDSGTHLFQAGEAASDAITAMAECGDLSGLQAGLPDNDTIVDPATGFLAPGTMTTTTIMTSDTNTSHLSVVAMILPTNDAFIGMDSQYIPSEAGTYTYYINGYDAGTEANDELLSTDSNYSCMPGEGGFMPGAPGRDADTGGLGVSNADTNTLVHIHRGILGDAAVTGDGASDLVNTIHRWQNPVAKIVVTVTP